MSRYYLFAGQNYYPSAGTGGIVAFDDSLVKLRDLVAVKNTDWGSDNTVVSYRGTDRGVDWAQIYDTETDTVSDFEKKTWTAFVPREPWYG